jgi:hypothetical protein
MCYGVVKKGITGVHGELEIGCFGYIGSVGMECFLVDFGVFWCFLVFLRWNENYYCLE